MSYRLIIGIVNRGFETVAVDAAREAGATGGTLVNAKGAGAREAEKAFGIAVQPEKELVLILSDKEKCPDIMRAIVNKVGLNTPGAGICFTLPVDSVLGVTMGIKELEEEPKEEEEQAAEE